MTQSQISSFSESFENGSPRKNVYQASRRKVTLQSLKESSRCRVQFKRPENCLGERGAVRTLSEMTKSDH